MRPCTTCHLTTGRLAYYSGFSSSTSHEPRSRPSSNRQTNGRHERDPPMSRHLGSTRGQHARRDLRWLRQAVCPRLDTTSPKSSSGYSLGAGAEDRAPPLGCPRPVPLLASIVEHHRSIISSGDVPGPWTWQLETADVAAPPARNRTSELLSAAGNHHRLGEWACDDRCPGSADAALVSWATYRPGPDYSTTVWEKRSSAGSHLLRIDHRC